MRFFMKQKVRIWDQKRSHKGAQSEAKIDENNMRGSHQRRLRDPPPRLTKFPLYFGDISDEKSLKRAMRSYTVFQYPKINENAM